MILNSEIQNFKQLRLRATVCSLIIHELSLIHYFAKSVGCMELSFMVLCKIDKYYNQVKFQVLWPRLKVKSSTVMLGLCTVGPIDFQFTARSATK